MSSLVQAILYVVQEMVWRRLCIVGLSRHKFKKWLDAVFVSEVFVIIISRNGLTPYLCKNYMWALVQEMHCRHSAPSVLLNQCWHFTPKEPSHKFKLNIFHIFLYLINILNRFKACLCTIFGKKYFNICSSIFDRIPGKIICIRLKHERIVINTNYRYYIPITA